MPKHVLHYTAGDADAIEQMVCGERYEMVQLPDSMMDTTLFVGNLCEFVTDDDLSSLFAQASSLNHVPACVARKANNDSLKYGFVTFPSIQEKEYAMIRFSGCKLNGRRIRVEEILDTPRSGRVRVPGKLVSYAVGDVKRTRDGKVNTMRRASDPRLNAKREAAKFSQKKKRKMTRSKSDNFKLFGRLNGSEIDAYQRAARHGFVTLDSTGFRRGRKNSPLANFHRKRCLMRGIPQIVLCKASGGRTLDNVIVDLSTIKKKSLSNENLTASILVAQYQKDILFAAEKAGMTLQPQYIEDNTLMPHEHSSVGNENARKDDKQMFSSTDTKNLSCVSMGVFEGERPRAKAMVKELVELWNTKDLEILEDENVVRTVPKGKGNFKKVDGKKKSIRDHRKERRQNKNLW